MGSRREKNLLEHLAGLYSEIGKFIYQEGPQSLHKRFAELNKMKVSQLMRKEVVPVVEDTELFEAARLMLMLKARRLPVVDKSDKVVGIIARCDILWALAGEGEKIKPHKERE